MEDISPIIIKSVPVILEEEDIRERNFTQQLDSIPIKDQMELNNQKHEHSKDERVTSFGFFIVCGVIILCFFMSIIGSFSGESGLFREFFTIAATTISLVLGYLFGTKRNK